MGISYVEFEDEAGVLRRYRKHVNGRGLVATTANVDPTAFVDPTAYVDPGAEVQRGAQISHGAWIDRDAIVAERAVVGVNVHVGRRAVVGRNAVIGPTRDDDRRRRRVPCVGRRPAPARPRGLIAASGHADDGCPGQMPGACSCLKAEGGGAPPRRRPQPSG